MEKFEKFARIAEVEFSDIVLSTHDLGLKLRIYLKDKSFIDFFYTTKLKKQRFSIHWERRHLDKTIFRVDNTPDKKWKKIKTFPLHFHRGKYGIVTIAPFKLKSIFSLEDVFREFLKYAKSPAPYRIYSQKELEQFLKDDVLPKK